jgi:hypothetical protein
MLSAITKDRLMSLTVKASFTKDLDPEIKDFIMFVAYKNGLVDEQEEKTDYYYALMNDDLEKLIRKLTGKQKQAIGLCACGCGRDPHGRGKYATAACRKNASRTLQRLKKEAA